MCLAVPLKILSVDGKQAVGEAGGLTQKLRVDFVPGIQPGDYAMVHAGFAIERNGFERASFSWYNQGRKNGVRP